MNIYDVFFNFSTLYKNYYEQYIVKRKTIRRKGNVSITDLILKELYKMYGVSGFDVVHYYNIYKFISFPICMFNAFFFFLK